MYSLIPAFYAASSGELTPQRLDLERRDLLLNFLRSANLSSPQAKLRILRGVFLKGAKLQGTDLTMADLSGANLSRANLKGANLSRANLKGANFESADLSRANLGGVIVAGADLTEANLGGVILTGANIEGAKGLTPGQVKAATNWQQAKYTPDFRKQLALPPESTP